MARGLLASRQVVELRESQSEVERVGRVLQQREEELQHAKAEVEGATEDVKEAIKARQKAEEDLEEVCIEYGLSVTQ